MRRDEWRSLFRMLTFVDDQDIEVQAFDYVDGRDEIRLPRGVLALLPKHVSVNDLRSRPPMPKIKLATTLDTEGHEGQTAALLAMFKHEQGMVIAPPGRGKTEIGLAFAAACKTRTLVVVHTNDLLLQWVQRAKDSVPGMEVGVIKGKTGQVGHLTVAMAQTLRRYVNAGGMFWRQFGCIIIDEGHYSAAETWEWLLNSCPAYYRFGLTATEKRADGRGALVKFLVGPVIYRIKFKSQVPLEVQPMRTGFRGPYRGPFDWSRLLRRLSADEGRNHIIAATVAAELREGHTVLVLSRQVKHLEHIKEMLDRLAPDVSDQAQVVNARLGKLRYQRIEAFKAGELPCIMATQLADEGLDVPRLDRVHLTFPGKHDGRIIQQIGRSIRKYQGKKNALITDYVDDFIPPLARQYVARKRAYKTLGIRVRKAGGYGTEKKQKRRLVPNLVQVARSRGA